VVQATGLLRLACKDLWKLACSHNAKLGALTFGHDTMPAIANVG